MVVSCGIEVYYTLKPEMIEWYISPNGKFHLDHRELEVEGWELYVDTGNMRHTKYVIQQGRRIRTTKSHVWWYRKDEEGNEHAAVNFQQFPFGPTASGCTFLTTSSVREGSW